MDDRVVFSAPSFSSFNSLFHWGPAKKARPSCVAGRHYLYTIHWIFAIMYYCMLGFMLDRRNYVYTI